ncbi:dimethylargininase [Homoserinimonas aerilata]|uniref:Dimethylargininase n=1 Tax=Homoserinimonas aerilata TaxID=1162970 RepID=A0A542YG71_9MICO|nr:dimethylargininase [Homoserinimonas aerilata]TQL46984.1 dimethylargininase [Homoserinimonas aerilata]
MAYPTLTLSPARRVGGALAAGAVVAVIAHAVTVFVFFVSSGADPANFATLSEFFQMGSLLGFVLLALAAALEAFRWWYVALPAGALAAVLAAYFGTMLSLVGQGNTLDQAAFAYLANSLVGPNLVFTVAAAVASATAGVAIWRRIAGSSAASERRIALVRLPASNLAEGEITHIERLPVNAELADQQWEQYVAALDAHGWEVVEVPVAEGHADSVFIEDTVVIFGTTAVIGSPGAASRIGETDAVESAVRGLRLKVSRIQQPGTLDGGDVLKVGRTVYVGSSGRTNAEGIRQLRGIVSPLGYTVVAVPMTKALHLKTAVTALPDGTVIGFEPFIDDTGLFERFLAVPEAEGAAVVVLDEGTVLMSAAAPKTAELLTRLGYDVVTVSIGEFEKLEGCVTCLSVRVR